MKKILIIVLLTATFYQARAVEVDTAAVPLLRESVYKDSLLTFRSIYKNRIVGIPDSFELALYTALRFYPDLNFDRIEIRYQMMSTSMEARPLPSSIVKKKKSRSFVIAINNRKGPHKGVDWGKADFAVLVGWFAHELGHCEQYTEKRFGGLVAMGVKYLLNKSYRLEVENNADIRAIIHDLGYCLYASKVFLHGDSGADDHYLKIADKFYLSPEGVLKKIIELKTVARQ